MKALASVLGLFLAVNLATALPNPGIPTPNLNLWNEWEKLGERTVDFSLDKDVIYVTGLEGRFTALKIKVRKGALNMHKVVVHFGDGTEKEVETRDNIAAGGETRVIDLPGNQRVINRVVFWYDTKDSANKKAEVELWGKKG